MTKRKSLDMRYRIKEFFSIRQEYAAIFCDEVLSIHRQKRRAKQALIRHYWKIQRPIDQQELHDFLTLD
jgi:hypothetical protein